MATSVGVLAPALTLTTPAHAQPLQYWGKQPHARTGWIELGNERFTSFVRTCAILSSQFRATSLHDE
jgi:hypothetical protein